VRVGRPDHPKNHLERDNEASVVDVIDLDVVFGDHRQGSDHHVPTGEGEPHRLSRRGVLVEHCAKRLRSSDTGCGGALSREDGPTGGRHTDIGGLARAFDGDVVLTSSHDGATESVPAELDRHPVAPVDELLGPVGEGEPSLPMELSETLVLGGLLGPLTPGTLAQFGCEIRVGVGSVFLGFSRSRQSL